MAPAWLARTKFKKLSAELAGTAGRDFQRRVRPYLRSLFPDLVEARDLRWIDQAGIDLYVWGSGDVFPVAVQCKGFEVRENELGRRQAQQCVASIEKLGSENVKVDRYILIHNREGRSQEFRDTVDDALQNLVSVGNAATAEQWSRHRFLREVGDALYSRAKVVISNRRAESTRSLHEQLGEPGPVALVPAELSQLELDQHGIKSESTRRVALIGSSALNSEVETMTLVLGEFGSGKTTLTSQFTANEAKPVLSVNAGALSSGSQSLFSLVLDPSQVFPDAEEEDSMVLAPLLSSVVGTLLREHHGLASVVVDGLDESARLAMAGGMHWFFNTLREVASPVVLTSRTEFWECRREEFSQQFGSLHRSGLRHRFNVRVVKLLPWGSKEIAVLARLTAESEERPQRDRLLEFAELAESGAYGQTYGDIPQRPLFLRMILDTVKTDGIPSDRVTRYELMRDWIIRKIRRDVLYPASLGEGRAPIVDGATSVQTTVELAWRAMTEAAGCMTEVIERRVELTDSCRVEDILADDRRLSRVVDHLGVTLHSLLIPATDARPERPRVRFAHRAFQEFFLAELVREERTRFPSDVSIPGPVVDWVTAEAMVRRKDGL